MTDRQLIDRIAFSQLKGMNAAIARAVLERVGSPEQFFATTQSDLWRQLGATPYFATDIERRRALALAEREAEFIISGNIHRAFITDADYPRRLDDCPDAPVMLYWAGDKKVLDSSYSIGIVGTRNATAYGAQFCNEVVADLARMLDTPVIVSGLAYGIDVLGHKAALAAGLPTVAVVAHGLRTVYPADHRDIARRICSAGGAMVSEYISSAAVHKGNFLARNRIVAGLTDVLVVVESDTRGGALATARIAGEYNRAVGAVPGRTTDRYSRGCNALIQRNMAAIVRDAGDILDLVGWKARPAEGTQSELSFPEIDPVLAPVVDFMRTHPDATIPEMARALDMQYAALAARVMEMEMDDIVTANPDGTYTLRV